MVTVAGHCACGTCTRNEVLQTLHNRWLSMMSILNERQTRLYAAERALELGWGGVMLLTRISGLSERTIRRGIQELQAADIAPGDFARSPGGGRKRLEEATPAIVDGLEALMGETTAGDPMRVLKWTTQSTRALAAALTRQGHAVIHASVARLLQAVDDSLRGNTTSLERQ